MIEEEFIKKESIRTMKKDIARLQEEIAAKGVMPKKEVIRPVPEPVPEPAPEEETERKEEELRRQEENRLKIEEERKMREKIEEERKKKEEEKLKLEVGKKAMALPSEAPSISEERRRAANEEQKGKEEGERKEKEELKLGKKELFLEKEKVEEEKNKVAESFQELAEKRKPLELEKTTILRKLEETKKNFHIIATKEREIEEEQRLVEEKEETAKTISEKRELEKKRWQIEEARRVLEKKRWPFDEKIRQLQDQLKLIESEDKKIELKEKQLLARQTEILTKEKEILAEIEKVELREELDKIEKFKKSLEEKKDEFLITLSGIKEKASEILAKEKKVEQIKKIIEDQERTAKGLKERQEFEKKRWEVEEKRREVEAQRWQIEEEKNKIESQLKNLERKIQAILAKKEEITAMLRGEKLVSVAPVPSPAAPPPAPALTPDAIPTPAKPLPKAEPLAPEEKSEEEKRIEEAKKRIESLKRETLELRKKEEQEQAKETEKEAEKINFEEKRRREMLSRIKEVKNPPPVLPKPGPPPQLIRVISKPPTLREKLGVRILIVSLILVFLAGIFTFWYWFFVAKRQPPIVSCDSDADCLAEQICNPEGICVSAPVATKCSKDADCPAGQVCNPEGICLKTEPGITIPSSLFTVDSIRNLTISNSEELKPLLLQTLQEWQEENQFARLIIENTKEKNILGLREFLETLLVRAPEELYQKLENGFTLFIYSQSEGNRLGFVTKIKNYEGLANLLRIKETTMESDFETFFTLMQKKGPAIIPYFRSAINVPGYGGANFRYQTINRQDLGILYLFSGDYFVFTSSWKSMEKVIGKLGITGERIELTTELKRGNRGYEVELLQSWLAQDSTIYPQAIVNGVFGPSTEAAVIRFQEKYATEILAPQGLSKGTGIVDSYTRIKLNELYGESGIKPRIVEITTDLRIGAYGEEVKLLQTWLAKDKKVYPEGIASGYFGYLTQQAVIRFQEKYATEILTPQGLTKGTGIVDALTRKKLNELYGQ